MNEWQQIARFWIVCMLFACAIALVSCAGQPIMLLMPAPHLPVSAPAPAVPMHVRPTYAACVDYCMSCDGDDCSEANERPTGVFEEADGSFTCQCGPFDA